MSKFFNDIEFPLLGSFADGEMVFQTKDAKDFCIAVLIDNKTFNLIVDTIQQDKELKSKNINPQKILALLADKFDNKEFSPYFPLCPICKSRQRNYGDSIRTTQSELNYVTWNEFESLTQENKLRKVREAI